MVTWSRGDDGIMNKSKELFKFLSSLEAISLYFFKQLVSF